MGILTHKMKTTSGVMFGFFVTVTTLVSIVTAQDCPASQRIDGFSCGGRDGIQCPPDSVCNRDPLTGGRFCCWSQPATASSPCEDPMMQGGQFVTCNPRQSGTCPGNCHQCQQLGQEFDLGLCCPQIRRRGCENSSPAMVEFERQRRRIAGDSGGAGMGAGGGTGSGGFGSGTSSTVGGGGFATSNSGSRGGSFGTATGARSLMGSRLRPRGSNSNSPGGFVSSSGGSGFGAGSNTAGGFGSSTSAGGGFSSGGFGGAGSSTSGGFGGGSTGFGSSRDTFGSGATGFGQGSGFGSGSRSGGFGSGSSGRGAASGGFGRGSSARGTGSGGFGTGATGFGRTTAGGFGSGRGTGLRGGSTGRGFGVGAGSLAGDGFGGSPMPQVAGFGPRGSSRGGIRTPARPAPRSGSSLMDFDAARRFASGGASPAPVASRDFGLRGGGATDFGGMSDMSRMGRPSLRRGGATGGVGGASMRGGAGMGRGGTGMRSPAPSPGGSPCGMAMPVGRCIMFPFPRCAGGLRCVADSFGERVCCPPSSGPPGPPGGFRGGRGGGLGMPGGPMGGMPGLGSPFGPMSLAMRGRGF